MKVIIPATKGQLKELEQTYLSVNSFYLYGKKAKQEWYVEED